MPKMGTYLLIESRVHRRRVYTRGLPSGSITSSLDNIRRAGMLRGALIHRKVV
jgi:hypothetical protein